MFNIGHYQGQSIWLSESTIAMLLISLSITWKGMVILVLSTQFNHHDLKILKQYSMIWI